MNRYESRSDNNSFHEKAEKGQKQEMKCHGIFHFWILYDDPFIKHTLKISVIFFKFWQHIISSF